MAAEPASFETLPPEIRLIIYRYAGIVHRDIHLYLHPRFHTSWGHELVLASRQPPTTDRNSNGITAGESFAVFNALVRLGKVFKAEVEDFFYCQVRFRFKDSKWDGDRLCRPSAMHILAMARRLFFCDQHLEVAFNCLETKCGRKRPVDMTVAITITLFPDHTVRDFTARVALCEGQNPWFLLYTDADRAKIRSYVEGIGENLTIDMGAFIVGSTLEEETWAVLCNLRSNIKQKLYYDGHNLTYGDGRRITSRCSRGDSDDDA